MRRHPSVGILLVKTPVYWHSTLGLVNGVESVIRLQVSHCRTRGAYLIHELYFERYIICKMNSGDVVHLVTFSSFEASIQATYCHLTVSGNIFIVFCEEKELI